MCLGFSLILLMYSTNTMYISLPYAWFIRNVSFSDIFLNLSWLFRNLSVQLTSAVSLCLSLSFYGDELRFLLQVTTNSLYQPEVSSEEKAKVSNVWTKIHHSLQDILFTYSKCVSIPVLLAIRIQVGKIYV